MRLEGILDDDPEVVGRLDPSTPMGKVVSSSIKGSLDRTDNDANTLVEVGPYGIVEVMT